MSLENLECVLQRTLLVQAQWSYDGLHHGEWGRTDMADLRLDGRKVLVVEDEFLLADDLARSLEEIGAVVVGPVRTVSAALALIESEPALDAALLDVNLGREKVFAVADALEALRVPFCFTTGYETSLIPERFAGVTRFEKPLNPEIVTRAISESLLA